MESSFLSSKLRHPLVTSDFRNFVLNGDHTDQDTGVPGSAASESAGLPGFRKLTFSLGGVWFKCPSQLLVLSPWPITPPLGHPQRGLPILGSCPWTEDAHALADIVVEAMPPRRSLCAILQTHKFPHVFLHSIALFLRLLDGLDPGEYPPFPFVLVRRRHHAIVTSVVSIICIVFLIQELMDCSSSCSLVNRGTGLLHRAPLPALQRAGMRTDLGDLPCCGGKRVSAILAMHSLTLPFACAHVSVVTIPPFLARRAHAEGIVIDGTLLDSFL